QFVVMTLLADRPRAGVQEAAAAFASPTIVHFSIVLFLSAALRAPWHSIAPFAVIWGSTGLCGALYTSNVIRRARPSVSYRPDLEDWIPHGALPLLAYGTLLVSAFLASSHEEEMLFVVAGAVLLTLFAAIHNAWDAIAYHVLVVRQKGAPE